MTDKLYLIDGSSFLYRAFYALPYLANSSGFPTRVVFGFLKMIKKILAEHGPTHIAVVFDPKGPTFRHEMMEAYKVHRPPMPEEIRIQIPQVRRALDALKIRTIVIDGLEADDVIAGLTAMYAGKAETVVVTSDKDLYQLVAKGALIWNPQKDLFVDRPKVSELLGVEPEQIADYLGLCGDASDGVPGVRGIGEKTALKLIREYGSIDSVIENVDRLAAKLKSLMEKGREAAILSRELCRLRDDPVPDVSLDDLRITAPDDDALRGLLKEMEFFDLMKEFGIASEVSFRFPDIIDAGGSMPRALTGRLYFVLRDAASASARLFVTADGRDVSRMEGAAVKRFFSEMSGQAWYTYEGKDVFRFCAENGITPVPFTDLSIISYLLNASASHGHGMADLFRDHFGSLPGDGKEVRKSLFDRDDEDRKLSPFLAHMPEIAGRLVAKLDREPAVRQFYEKIEHPLTGLLARMEADGIGIDTGILDGMNREITARIHELEKTIYGLAGRTFNLNSPKQLSAVLYEDMGLSAVRKGKAATSTASDVLDELYDAHPVVPAILDYRNIMKLKSTYLDVLPGFVRGDGRIHTTFNQTQTATGRLSSSNPNLQNIPVRQEWGERIRSAFVADPGNLLVSADYSQIEIRLLAALSGDELLIGDFRSGADIHAATAAKIFGVPQDQVSREMRRKAKTINFGILYGMGAYSLSREIKVTPAEAETYIRKYFEHYGKVREYREGLIETARQNKYVSTLWGRKRFIYEIGSQDPVARQNAERIALNTPLQGTAADVMKKAMLDVHRALTERGSRFRLLLQIHDEILLEVAADEADAVMTTVKEKMAKAADLPVPLEVRVGKGANWYEAAYE